MNSSVSTLQRRLMVKLLALLMMLTLLLLYSHSIVVGVIHDGRQETEILNATGRQRTLVQQFVRQANLALVGLSIADWEILIEQRKLSAETSAQFDQTMYALLQGGKTSIGKTVVTLPKVDAPEVRASLEEIATLWAEVKRASIKVLRSEKSQLQDHPDLALMQSAAMRLVEKVDDTLQIMQQRSIERADQLIRYLKAILLGGLGVFVLLATFVHRSIISPLAKTIGKLDQSEEQHRNLYDTAPVGLWQAEISNGHLLKYNVALARLLGSERENSDNKKSIYSLLSDDAARFKSTLESRGEVTDFETTLLAADGQKKSLIVSARQYPEKGFSEGAVVDITARKLAETELEAANKQLVENSRQAGMAEIATNVLHNVGNVLNSVNVSASLVISGVRDSKISSLAKVANLLREHYLDLGTFFASDNRGKQLPAYLAQLSEHLISEQVNTIEELNSLRKNVEHINVIVAMQQNYARFSGAKETVNIRELVEDSVRMNEGMTNGHSVQFLREFEDVPSISAEKHKILQILINLVRNAKHACQESDNTDKRVTMRVQCRESKIRIAILDNGAGIPTENLIRIFNHGFTTRKDGHGFGLHSGALAAKEMGGSLTVHSDGPGQGALFTLELPCDSCPDS